ncbi:MAG: TIGR04149 family rSAM-modified RiPP [Dysgonamonadaceae bacterium]|jgi:natural product precursor|nr:TIGR04149 family rSAM-modified RiPP [Dysgonamonadaceae bacterium]
MKTLKKISLKTISDTLSERELKSLVGGGYEGDKHLCFCSQTDKYYYITGTFDYAMTLIYQICGSNQSSGCLY